jgi:hypothetical protein
LFDQRQESFDGSRNLFDGSQKLLGTSQYLVEQSRKFFDKDRKFNHPDSNVFDMSRYVIDPGIVRFDPNGTLVASACHAHDRVCCVFDAIPQLFVEQVSRATAAFHGDTRNVCGYSE